MKNIKSGLIVVLGNFILAISVVYFVLPFGIMSGGVAGISLIIQGLTGVDPTIMIDVLMIGLFILGYFFLGKEFAIKTGISSIVYPLFVTILNRFPISFEADALLIAITGAVIGGFGVGIVFKEDASTGGTDIPPLIIHKYTGIELHKLFMVMDGMVVLCSLIVCGAQMVMIGLIYTYIINMTISKVMVPKTDTAVSLYIISNKMEEIRDFIQVDLYRGTTILSGKGGYTNEQKEIILTVVSRNQYPMLEKKIAELDPTAFVIVSDAKDIKGEGFTYDVRV